MEQSAGGPEELNVPGVTSGELMGGEKHRPEADLESRGGGRDGNVESDAVEAAVSSSSEMSDAAGDGDGVQVSHAGLEWAQRVETVSLRTNWERVKQNLKDMVGFGAVQVAIELRHSGEPSRWAGQGDTPAWNVEPWDAIVWIGDIGDAETVLRSIVAEPLVERVLDIGARFEFYERGRADLESQRDEVAIIERRRESPEPAAGMPVSDRAIHRATVAANQRQKLQASPPETPAQSPAVGADDKPGTNEAVMPVPVSPPSRPTDNAPDATGQVRNPLDPSAYVAANKILADHCHGLPGVTHKRLQVVLRQNPEIKRWRPNPQRLCVHLADWTKYADETRAKQAGHRQSERPLEKPRIAALGPDTRPVAAAGRTREQWRCKKCGRTTHLGRSRAFECPGCSSEEGEPVVGPG